MVRLNRLHCKVKGDEDKTIKGIDMQSKPPKLRAALSLTTRPSQNGLSSQEQMSTFSGNSFRRRKALGISQGNLHLIDERVFEQDSS